jgi:hypothetical protein
MAQQLIFIFKCLYNVQSPRIAYGIYFGNDKFEECNSIPEILYELSIEQV